MQNNCTIQSSNRCIMYIIWYELVQSSAVSVINSTNFYTTKRLSMNVFMNSMVLVADRTLWHYSMCRNWCWSRVSSTAIYSAHDVRTNTQKKTWINTPKMFVCSWSVIAAWLAVILFSLRVSCLSLSLAQQWSIHFSERNLSKAWIKMITMKFLLLSVLVMTLVLFAFCAPTNIDSISVIEVPCNPPTEYKSGKCVEFATENYQVVW